MGKTNLSIPQALSASKTLTDIPVQETLSLSPRSRDEISVFYEEPSFDYIEATRVHVELEIHSVHPGCRRMYSSMTSRATWWNLPAFSHMDCGW